MTSFQEIEASAAKLTAALLGVYDTKSKLMAQSTAPPESLATMPLMFAVVVPPGKCRVRRAATADGPALLQAVPAGSGTKDPDRFIISGVFPIASLEPGDYVMRATVGIPESGEGRLTRTLRKVK